MPAAPVSLKFVAPRAKKAKVAKLPRPPRTVMPPGAMMGGYTETNLPTAPIVPTAPTIARPNVRPNITPASTAGAQTRSTVFDPSTDPMVAAVQAANAAAMTQMRAKAKEQQRQMLIGYGSQELAKKVLGADDPTIGSISHNPNTSTSTLARIARGYRETVASNEEQLNKANLFYGGYRLKRLGDLSYQNQAQQADAAQQMQAALQGIQDQIAAEHQSESDRYLQSLSDAYGRWISQPPPDDTPPGADPTNPPGGPQVGGVPQPTLPGPNPGSTVGAFAPPGSPAGDKAGIGFIPGLTPPPPAGGAKKYYTYKDQVPLKPGQKLKFTAGRGYYAE